MKLLREFLFIALLVLLGSAFSLLSGTASPPWRAPELAPGEIRAEDASALDPVWVDARSAAEYEAGHIPGAVLLEEAEWETGLLRLLETWTPGRVIVVYCGSEDCGTSRRVADALDAALGGAEIYTLQGGWEAWAE